MDIPSWADEELSKDLPILRARGEGQHLEYKQSFPENTRNLASEIAAFATSNQGTILIGVSDSGDLVGINGADHQEERDNLLNRLEGICRGTVKPAITPIARFAVENELVVLVINVPKGRQPIYYSNNIPYVRNLTASRHAEPHEVLELITEYLSTQKIGEGENNIKDERSDFYSSLSRVLGVALIYADQAVDRMINPWLEQWRSEFSYIASELRNFSVEDIAIAENITNELNELAFSLDSVASFQLTFGCAPQIKKLIEETTERLVLFKKDKIDSIKLSDNALIQAKKSIIIISRKLNDLVGRSADMVEMGSIDELQNEASDYGYQLLIISQYGIEFLGDLVKDKLFIVGRELHLLETMRLSMDGGKSLRAIIEKISNSSNSLRDIVDNLM